MTPCANCIYRSSLWGMAFCQLGKWSGEDFEKLCAEFRRKHD